MFRLVFLFSQSLKRLDKCLQQASLRQKQTQLLQAFLFSFVATILGYGLEHNLGKVIGVCGQTESLDAKQQQSKSK